MLLTYTKLAIIQTALSNEGENIPAIEDDGSPEWDVCSRYYDLKVPSIIQEHSWAFATTNVTLVEASSNPSKIFPYAYLRPPGALHILGINFAGASGLSSTYRIDEYDMIDGTIVSFVAPADGLTAKIVRVTPDDITSFAPMLVEGIVKFVQSAILRGLKEDKGAADNMELDANAKIKQAMTRNDQEKPPRTIWRSRIRERMSGFRTGPR